MEWNEGHMKKVTTDSYKKEWKITGYREDRHCHPWCKCVFCLLDIFLGEEAVVPFFISHVRFITVWMNT